MMMLVRKALLRFLPGRMICVVGLLLQGVWGIAATGDWFAREWRTDEGLPDNDVTSVVQGPDGFLWVGTRGGLERFDGNQFEDFPTEDVTHLPIHGIRTLLVGHGSGSRDVCGKGYGQDFFKQRRPAQLASANLC